MIITPFCRNHCARFESVTWLYLGGKEHEIKARCNASPEGDGSETCAGFEKRTRGRIVQRGLFEEGAA